MARTFRRARQSHPIAELNVTNLIDLGFTLLIIFMIATPLINQEQTIRIDLPGQGHATQAKPEKNTFVAVSVDAAGKYYIDNREISLTELRSTLRGYATRPQPPIMRIRGDRSVPYEKVVQLMDELTQANLLKITIDTQVRGAAPGQ